MAINKDSTKCKSCARVLATVTPTGLSPATSPEPSKDCATCQQFSMLFDAVQAADTDWAMYQNKRDSVTKSCARESYKRAHMEFQNWLMIVEAPMVAESKDDAEVEQQDQSTKRRHSHSPTIQKFSDTTEMPHELAQHHNMSLSLRPSPKRARSMASLPRRKRLKFSETVEFPASYRSSEEYHRPSETYVRGRNAPPEGSEYMDTSGSGQTFLRFTQMKKVGAKWVELSEEELAKKNEDAKVAAEQRKLGTAEKAKPQETNGRVTGDLGQDEKTVTNGRTTRSARRARETLGAGPTQANMATLTQARSGNPPRKPKETQLDGGLARAQEACSDLVLAFSTHTADDSHMTACESLSGPGNIGVGKQRLEGQRLDDAEKASTETRHNGRASATDIPPQEPHKGTCKPTSTIACQGDAIQHHTGHVVIETPMLQPEPMGNASSCTGWEDASTASATTDDRPVAAQMLGEQPTSIVHDDTVIVSRTAGGQGPIQSS